MGEMEQGNDGLPAAQATLGQEMCTALAFMREELSAVLRFRLLEPTPSLGQPPTSISRRGKPRRTTLVRSRPSLVQIGWLIGVHCSDRRSAHRGSFAQGAAGKRR